MPTKRTVLAELTLRELRAGLDFYELRAVRGTWLMVGECGPPVCAFRIAAFVEAMVFGGLYR